MLKLLQKCLSVFILHVTTSKTFLQMFCKCLRWLHVKQESRAVARKLRDAAAVLLG